MSAIEHSKIIKCQRLCVDEELVQGTSISLNAGHVHYLKNVLRLAEGAPIRVFNGRDGEWLSRLSYCGKKEAVLLVEECLQPQPDIKAKITLAFAPIKKNRMDFLIEKSVELGAHKLRPVVTQNTEVRAIKEERITQQIREAAEQCERLDLPVLLPIQNLSSFLTVCKDKTVLACIERSDTKPLKEAYSDCQDDITILVGPEGGFTKEEIALIAQHDNVIPVSLGDNVLRSETACLKALSQVF